MLTTQLQYIFAEGGTSTYSNVDPNVNVVNLAQVAQGIGAFQARAMLRLNRIDNSEIEIPEPETPEIP